MEKPVLFFVIPCYNESQVLPLTAPLFADKVTELARSERISESSRVLFADDGSSDCTWQIISRLSQENPIYCGIRLSRNRGHQNALLAGLDCAARYADITVSMDCDGQDDINAVNEMVELYLNEGCDIVYGVREDRSSDSFFKRTSAEMFYKLIAACGAEVVSNHADYRLMSARAVKELLGFKEVNLFLRGMVPLVGFKSGQVRYIRHERAAGKSHYPLKKMVAFAIDGITSFSVRPLRIITLFGLIVSALSFAGAVWAFIQQIRGMTVAGWASTTCITCFIGGIQLISLGIIGEYIGKIYLEVKQRPRFIVSEKTDNIDKN